jgi:serine/threonine-protein kinase
MSEQTDPMINTVVAGRYRILGPLGEGGMGQVYLAEHEAIEKKVALKVLRPEYSTKPDIVVRFQQEAISASRIKHPNVLDVFDFGRLENGCFFLAMEFLEGNDLADELVRKRTIDPERGIKIVLQICRALTAAHARGVVHRDLKPENVFLQRTPDGEEIVKIVDFGIAQLRSPEEAAASEPKRRRLTRTGMIFGTPEYMAPEQAGGKNADLRVDIYALGVILYEMFTGAVPFTGETFLQVLTRHLQDTAPPMSAMCPDLRISAELQAVIMKALSKEPADRHASMVQFAAAILGTPEGRGAGLGAARASMPEFAATYSAPMPHASGQGAPTAAQFGTTAPIAPPSPSAFTPASPTLSQGSAESAMGGATAVSRSTQLDAETSPPGTARKSSWPLVAVLGAVGLLGAGGATALFLMKPRTDSATAPTPASSTIAPAPTRETPAQEPVVAATPPSASAAPSASIHLSVETVPAGAVLLKNGFQVCDSTPCEVLASDNETVEFEARKGALRGKAKVLAQKDQRVKISLAGAGAAAKPKPAAHLCERFDPNLGIKIMTPCN